MSATHPNEVEITLWNDPVGHACHPIGPDPDGDPGDQIYSEPVARIRSVHVPRVGELVGAGSGVWRVLAVQWGPFTQERSMAWEQGDRGAWAELSVEPTEGIFWRPEDAES